MAAIRSGRESAVPCSWAIICRKHGQVFLTRAEYSRQSGLVDRLWTCPRCGRKSNWDDDNYEEFLDQDKVAG